MLLCVDTSSAVSVALHDGTDVLAAWSGYDPRRHAELLAPQVVEVLDEANATIADVTRVVAGVGPGPFTGLRVALVTAQIFGATWDVPVCGVMSLDGLALTASRHPDRRPDTPLVVATDARRREVYWAVYDAAGARIAGPQVSTPADDALQQVVTAGPVDVVGRGVTLYPEHLCPSDLVTAGVVCTLVAGTPAGDVLDPVAADIARVAAGQIATVGPDWAGEPVVPVYLRRPDAVAPGQQKKVGS